MDISLIQYNTEEIIPRESLIEKLQLNRPLRIKFGADPSAPDLHLGHTVILRKLKELQKLGHEVIFLIGDFTAMIGDPTGKSETRKPLSKEQVLENAKSYQDQIFRILDREKTQVVYNSTWLRTLSAIDMVKLTSKYTVARMLERDDFEKRFKNEQSICVHEFLYPLFQGYDSVELNADIEIGGTDQKFNLLMGRHLQKEYGQNPQVIITMPILEGTDGVQKMSKSLGNHIGITESPSNIFGKIMSIPDSLIIRYYKLLTPLSPEKITELEAGLANGTQHPREVKDNLAYMITQEFCGDENAAKARDEFKRVFSNSGIPDNIPTITLPAEEIKLVAFLQEHGLVTGNREYCRLIEQGAISINGEKITRDTSSIIPEKDLIIKVGKRKFIKIIPK
ncbi:MAG: tyrosine--tRNA ligase [Candidatus Margulisiibacteriota bacterium]|nr:MAG: tyrosine--tRNA ligase [Candidatus Margulisbacteria bacterium GWD2_39_127]OGI03780.1 MAG: tyrosine--tRNA ligase [Candidatus Margulisbacteria bacterium GWF2_38_17]OGI05836.1 MAG: tyrosine--tRNA ligase [Candidatus Margulisbacteria bacterium GWE2_39_32]PZM82326.1 MAG: tyrosine--tRNA ligase [Candidatus Margulisiibacteriota bacterium]HAR64112.1 tyrosine--tRNA ligase [Candidatus Margulisiibacteriota bacterium]